MSKAPRDPVLILNAGDAKTLQEAYDELQKERDELIEAIQIANKYFIKIIKGRYDCPHDNMAECALDEIKELEGSSHAKE